MPNYSKNKNLHKIIAKYLYELEIINYEDAAEDILNLIEKYYEIKNCVCNDSTWRMQTGFNYCNVCGKKLK